MWDYIKCYYYFFIWSLNFLFILFIAVHLQQPPIVPILGYGAIGQGQNIVALAGQQPQVIN